MWPRQFHALPVYTDFYRPLRIETAVGSSSAWSALAERCCSCSRSLPHGTRVDDDRFDAVRPVSAIRFLYRDQTISSRAGPGGEMVTDLPGAEWRSFPGTANHSEYPSGSAYFLVVPTSSHLLSTGCSRASAAALLRPRRLAAARSLQRKHPVWLRAQHLLELREAVGRPAVAGRRGDVTGVAVLGRGGP